MTENFVSSDILDPEIMLSRIEEEINRLAQTKSTILGEKLGWAPIFALIIAVLLNIWGFATQTTTYMVVWISASLYFYLFYPMLPLFLFPFRYLSKKHEVPKVDKKKESMLKWAKKLKIFKNKRVGFRLFMRFFILSLLPLTIGMICIYLISIIFSIYLGNTGFIPADTSNLILVQSAGIILFYIEIFFFRHQLFNFAEYVRKQKSMEWKKLIILSVLGFALLIIGTIVVFLLLIAILLPGFTLASFINVSEFVRVRSNIWVLLILISQVIIMQYLQSVLSIRISRNMCDDLMMRLKNSRIYLEPGTHIAAKESTIDNLQDEHYQMKKPLRVLKETELYAFNRWQMFGLFPTYSIGVNVPNLFGIQTLNELKEVFVSDE